MSRSNFNWEEIMGTDEHLFGRLYHCLRNSERLKKMVGALFPRYLPMPRWLVKRGEILFITPNRVSYLGFLFALAVAPVYYADQLLLVALCVVLNGIFDFLDGMVAKIQNDATNWGKFLDALLDKVSWFVIALSTVPFAIIDQWPNGPLQVAKLLPHTVVMILISYYEGRLGFTRIVDYFHFLEGDGTKPNGLAATKPGKLKRVWQVVGQAGFVLFLYFNQLNEVVFQLAGWFCWSISLVALIASVPKARKSLRQKLEARANPAP